MHLGGFGGHLEGAKKGSSLVQGGFGTILLGFFVVFRGHKPQSEISKNVDFPSGKLIFSRVEAMKSRTKIEQNSMLEALKRKKGASEAKICVLEAKNFDVCTQDGDFRIPRARFWRQKGEDKKTC